MEYVKGPLSEWFEDRETRDKTFKIDSTETFYIHKGFIHSVIRHEDKRDGYDVQSFNEGSPLDTFDISYEKTKGKDSFDQNMKNNRVRDFHRNNIQNRLREYQMLHFRSIFGP